MGDPQLWALLDKISSWFIFLAILYLLGRALAYTCEKFVLPYVDYNPQKASKKGEDSQCSS